MTLHLAWGPQVSQLIYLVGREGHPHFLSLRLRDGENPSPLPTSHMCVLGFPSLVAHAKSPGCALALGISKQVVKCRRPQPLISKATSPLASLLGTVPTTLSARMVSGSFSFLSP